MLQPSSRVVKTSIFSLELPHEDALALRNHDSGAGANTHVDDNSSASVKVQPQMASYTTDVVHQREGFVQLR